MKWFLLSLFTLVAASTEAQIAINISPQQKMKDWKLMSISFALDKYSSMNMPGTVRGSNRLVIDVNAIRHPEKVYNYSELSEKLYAPAPTYLPAAVKVPYFLLMPPPVIKMPDSFTRGRRNTGC